MSAKCSELRERYGIDGSWYSGLLSYPNHSIEGPTNSHVRDEEKKFKVGWCKVHRAFQHPSNHSPHTRQLCSGFIAFPPPPDMASILRRLPWPGRAWKPLVFSSTSFRQIPLEE